MTKWLFIGRIQSGSFIMKILIIIIIITTTNTILAFDFSSMYSCLKILGL